MSIQLLTKGNTSKSAINYEQLLSASYDKSYKNTFITTTNKNHTPLAVTPTLNTYLFWKFIPFLYFQTSDIRINISSGGGNLGVTTYFFKSSPSTLKPFQQLFHFEHLISSNGDININTVWKITGPSTRESVSLTTFSFNPFEEYWIGMHFNGSTRNMRYTPIEAVDTFLSTTDTFLKNAILITGINSPNLYINTIEELGGSPTEVVQNVPQIRFLVV